MQFFIAWLQPLATSCCCLIRKRQSALLFSGCGSGEGSGTGTTQETSLSEPIGQRPLPSIALVHSRSGHSDLARKKWCRLWARAWQGLPVLQTVPAALVFFFHLSSERNYDNYNAVVKFGARLVFGMRSSNVEAWK